MTQSSIFPALFAAILLTAQVPAGAQTSPVGSHTARPLIMQQVDNTRLIALKGSVRSDLTPDRDMGPVEDALPLHLYLVLKRSPEQQAELDNFIARQQQPTAPEYHKWLTPQEFGERFGVAEQDIAELAAWLQSRGFQVRGVMNNASFIDFAATAGQVRAIFHAPLDYYNIQGGKHPANTQDPMIPAALEPAVAGIEGLVKIPPHTNHTPIRQASYDTATHRWHLVDFGSLFDVSPAYTDGSGSYDVTPQDFYTIYNVNKVFTGGNLAAKATVAVIEESDIEYGTVNSGTGSATGGDVATFRSLFGVPGTLNMHVYHGYGTVTCTDPGIDPNNNGEEGEAALDAEWANALAPSANLIFMSCDQVTDQGIFTSMMALIDNNLSDSMSLSYGNTELNFTSSDYAALDSLYAQAASQGQSFFVSSGDSGSDVADQNTKATATSGINVSAFGAPNVTVMGGTDFSDLYDADEGGAPQSNYWGGSNSANYSDALSYIPETAWNDSCASSIVTHFEGYSGAGYCGLGLASDPFIKGDVVGGSGGFSTHYAVPSYQSGILGYSGSRRAQPDISGFASNGFWGHALVLCDSFVAGTSCTSPSTFGLAGGTSFVAPYTAGIGGLLVNYTGSRQGLWNPTLYALGKAQFTASATKTACYSNGQTSNTGVTTGLPASTCIFNDVTTSNNDVPCQKGSTNCYVNPSASYGMLSLTNSSSLTVAYPSTPGYDEVSGIGTLNVYNLLTQWNTAFTSTTALTANPTSITSSQSTKLTATMTTGTPSGYVGTPPAVTGSVSFAAGMTPLGNCTLSGGTCSLNVSGSSLQSGANSITATFSGSGTYPSSTSSTVTVTVSGGSSGTPSVVSVTPTPAAGLTNTFALEYSDTAGNAGLSFVAVIFNSAASAPNTCYAYYYSAGNRLYLENDGGTGALGPITPGSGTLSNSQCTITGSGTSITRSGNTLTLNLDVTAGATFTGEHNIFMMADDTSGVSSGWLAKGVWTPGTNQAPTVVSVTPTPATGLTNTFALQYSDPNGNSDLDFVGVIFNSSALSSNTCYAYYYPATNRLYLENDGGTGASGPITPGSGTLSNSQCTIAGSGTSVVRSGNTLTLDLAVTASSTFTGKHGIFMMALDESSARSGWVAKGVWTPGTNQPPTVISVTPTPATGLTNTFALQYSDANGNSDLDFAGVIFNTAVNSAHACYAYYYPASNLLYLRNDAGTGASGSITPGSGTLSNSQCTIAGSGTSVVRSGNTLTLHLNVTASGSFTGAKKIYLEGIDNSNAASGWVNKGTWTP